MVRYYGRARQRTGSVNTNQLGLKMSGCVSKVGRSAFCRIAISHRVKCNEKRCGDVVVNGDGGTGVVVVTVAFDIAIVVVVVAAVVAIVLDDVVAVVVVVVVVGNKNTGCFVVVVSTAGDVDVCSDFIPFTVSSDDNPVVMEVIVTACVWVTFPLVTP